MHTHAPRESTDSRHAHNAGRGTAQLTDRRPEVQRRQQVQQLAQNSLQVNRQLALQAKADEALRGKLSAIQRATIEDEEPLQGKFATAQRAPEDEEEPLQGKFATAQRAPEDEEEPLQGKFATVQRAASEEAPPRPNNTGMPDNLKSGIETLSGMSMDGVQVHYNSSKPAQLNAHAYAQGTDIHIAPGQERHLPHEAWHVVQQAQGRVRPTMQMKESVQVNDDAALEHEADVMGARANETPS